MTQSDNSQKITYIWFLKSTYTQEEKAKQTLTRKIQIQIKIRLSTPTPVQN